MHNKKVRNELKERHKNTDADETVEIVGDTVVFRDENRNEIVRVSIEELVEYYLE